MTHSTRKTRVRPPRYFMVRSSSVRVILAGVRIRGQWMALECTTERDGNRKPGSSGGEW